MSNNDVNSSIYSHVCEQRNNIKQYYLMGRWYFLWFNEIDKIFSILDSVFTFA